MKKIYILLFITFISNLTSMQIQDEKEGIILDLPNEILDNIIQKVMEEDFKELKKKLNNWNDIFESPKINLSLIADLAKTCSRFRDICQYIFELKKIKFELLFKNLKNESLEEYKDISKEELNNRLANLLNNVLKSTNSNSKEELRNAVKLILAGADINATAVDGCTTLMKAAKDGHKEIVEILIKVGADVNAKDKDDCTVLMEAACNGDKEIVRMLLNKGTEVNIQDNDAWITLLWENILGKNKEIAEILIKNKK